MSQKIEISYYFWHNLRVSIINKFYYLCSWWDLKLVYKCKSLLEICQIIGIFHICNVNFHTTNKMFKPWYNFKPKCQDICLSEIYKYRSFQSYLLTFEHFCGYFYIFWSTKFTLCFRVTVQWRKVICGLKYSHFLNNCLPFAFVKCILTFSIPRPAN